MRATILICKEARRARINRERCVACETDGWHKSDHFKCSDSVNRELLCKSAFLPSLPLSLSLFLTASLPLFIHFSLAAFALLIYLLHLSLTSSFTSDAHFLSRSLNYIQPLSCISRQQANASAPPAHFSISLSLSDSSCYFSPSLGFHASLPGLMDGRPWLCPTCLSFCYTSCFSFSSSQSYSCCDCHCLLPSSIVLQLLLCSLLHQPVAGALCAGPSASVFRRRSHTHTYILRTYRIWRSDSDSKERKPEQYIMSIFNKA